jgi:hypothetical protein
MRLTTTIELNRPGRKTMLCEYQSNPVAKVGFAVPVIRKSFYRSIPIASHTFRFQLWATFKRVPRSFDFGNDIDNNYAMRKIIDC